MSDFDVKILLGFQLIGTFGMFAVIWLVQLVIYPVFLFIQPSRFFVFHALHTNRITLVVGPLMLVELGSCLGWMLYRPDWLSILGFFLVVVIWINTAFVSVPLHNNLAVEKNVDQRESLAKRLIRTNWVRTGAWTARAAICAVYVFQRS
jgi:hypothetical protein